MNAAPPLLEQAVRYALAVTRDIPHAQLSRPTPCREWDLAMLLAHANESLAALAEGAVAGHVAPPAPDELAPDELAPDELAPSELAPSELALSERESGHREPDGPTSPCHGRADGHSALVGPPRDLLATFRQRARRLPSLWTVTPRVVGVADRAMPADLMAAAGALEIAVHAWDIARSCRRDLPIPAAVAVELFSVGAVLVPANDRHPFFAPQAKVAVTACPSDRLVAFLGRDPG
ncbi:maleylpyruvate isomerase N-terminal domain-containing protein [Streptodolium elevatio]|uniref:Maleylpyruvate isomerase N-terminal domain-containing protein n=1 Tax=Streptodolium elevatio TaxID=3157996 RepID=A0ABV3DRB2_9ACTN